VEVEPLTLTRHLRRGSLSSLRGIAMHSDDLMARLVPRTAPSSGGRASCIQQFIEPAAAARAAGQPLAAAALLSQALALQPRNASILRARAEVLLSLNKVTQALQDASVLVELHPESHQVVPASSVNRGSLTGSGEPCHSHLHHCCLRLSLAR
jgi:hypothetical protein